MRLLNFETLVIANKVIYSIYEETLSVLNIWNLIFYLAWFKAIRPSYVGGNDLVIYFLGVAPNFFPGIGIPSFFM